MGGLRATSGFRALGFRISGFRVLGFRGLEVWCFRGLGPCSGWVGGLVGLRASSIRRRCAVRLALQGFGFRALGLRALEFKVLGFRVEGFRVQGFRV